MTVTAQLDGEGIMVNREISEAKAMRIMQIILENKETEASVSLTQEPDEDSEDTDEAKQEHDTLPDSFFSRLTDRQEAYVRILAEADDWVSNEEIRQRLKEDYNLDSAGPQAVAGIRSGFTRKYGDGFSVDKRDWMGDQNQYRLNEQYREEIEERWA